METNRSSGVVMHVSSLPGPHGIGTFGAGARAFVDFLQRAGQRYWQMLPLVPTGFGDSPYQSCSGSAGNPYFIDLERLVEEGLLTRDETESADFGDSVDYVDYGRLYENRLPLLRLAFRRGRAKLARKIRAFEKQNRDWLADYALYMAQKEKFGMAPLSAWPDADLLARRPEALAAASAELAEEIEFHVFLQYLFFSQYAELKAYAEKAGVRIIGDLPIYVSEDSVEVWCDGPLFALDGPARPSAVAGVPPDLYSASGQLWGNPLYDWSAHERDGFSWWIDRLKRLSRLCDVIRIDHFRAFHTYWEVPAGEETALNGHWKKGPGMKLIKAIRQALPETGIIAEDLGDLDEKARAFIHRSGIPGMSVLVYAFDPGGDSMYLPHNIGRERIAYTSTHDSPAFVDWLANEAGAEERAFAADYLRLREDEGIAWGAIKSVWASPAMIAMAPMQDVLGLGADARMNRPSTLGGLNWRWRVREEALNDQVARTLRQITHVYRRLNA